jgi:hypothetical protein
MKSKKTEYTDYELRHPCRRVGYRVRFAFLILILLVVGLLLLTIWWPSQSLPLMSYLDEVEEEVKTGLIKLTRTSCEKAPRRLHSYLALLDSQMGSLKARYDATSKTLITKNERERFIQTAMELGRLRQKTRAWLEIMSSEREYEVWEEIVLEVLHERTRWPIAGVVHPPSQFSMQTIWLDFRQGVFAGIAWPIQATSRTIGTKPRQYGVLRRIFFPYSRYSAMRAGLIAGFGLAALATGYALCWLGGHLQYNILGYLGLLYFLYLLIFAVCLLVAGLGLIA